MNVDKRRQPQSRSAPDSSTCVVRLEAVTKSYQTAVDAHLEVLKGIDLEVRRAETMAIVGPSGSGKSTLLNIMGTLDFPSSGRVQVAGSDPTMLTERELAHLRCHKIGFVFQLHHLLPQCTVFENVLIPALATAEAVSTPVMERAEYLLQRAGLHERREARPPQLSGGERQRVAVVRALINKPTLLLADEPTGSLDRTTAAKLVELLLDLNREEGVAVVVVTHSREVAARMQHVFNLEDGRLVRRSAP